MLIMRVQDEYFPCALPIAEGCCFPRGHPPPRLAAAPTEPDRQAFRTGCEKMIEEMDTYTNDSGFIAKEYENLIIIEVIAG